jgi:uncharacterized protein with HEPN domain
MDDRPEVLILHIRDVAAEIAGLVGSTSIEELRHDVMRERGLVMSVMVIGELASRIAENHPDIVAALPQVPWARIRGLRNRIAHGYFELDLDIVWDVAVNAVPDFAGQLVARLDPRQISS